MTLRETLGHTQAILEFSAGSLALQRFSLSRGLKASEGRHITSCPYYAEPCQVINTSRFPRHNGVGMDQAWQTFRAAENGLRAAQAQATHASHLRTSACAFPPVLLKERAHVAAGHHGGHITGARGFLTSTNVFWTYDLQFSLIGVGYHLQELVQHDSADE